MKTVLLAPELFRSEGGITRILRLYLKALCEIAGDSDKVGFLALNDSVVDSHDLSMYSNGRIAEWDVCNRSKLRFVRSVFRMCSSADRVICGHVAQLPVAWMASLLRPRLSYYLVAHGIEVWRPFSLIEKMSLRGATKIFCVSEYTRQKILRWCPMRPDKLVVVPNALDPYFEPRALSSPEKSPPVVLSISRLSTSDNYKGIDHLVAAMPAIHASIPGAKLRVVGRGDGLPGLQKLARKLGVSSLVEFAGYRSDLELREDIEKCSLFALPSEKEGFGLVYLEAMAHGRPCLGARSGGVPEVITPETGVLVEYGNVPEIAAAVVAALNRDWDLAPLVARAHFFSYPRFRDRLRLQLSR